MAMKKLHIKISDTLYACGYRRGAGGGYNGTVTVFEKGRKMYSLRCPIEALTQYDAQMNAKQLAKDTHFQNGLSMEEWKGKAIG